MVDPFEEFEFKPITEGLGFHKKKNIVQGLPLEIDNHSKSDKSSGPALDIRPTNENLMKSSGLDLISEPLSPTLPRKKSTYETPEIDHSKSAVDEILNTLNKRRLDIDFDPSRDQLKSAKKSQEQKQIQFVNTTMNFSAAFLDGMLVVAASLLCMIALLLITKVDLVGNLSRPDDEGMIYLSTFSVFAGVAFIYLVVNRAFMGYTPGEWAFDIRLGSPKENESALYILKLIARSFLQIATGFILLPILSALLKKDLAGAITGVSLMKQGR